jgi:hypothetical protein
MKFFCQLRKAERTHGEIRRHHSGYRILAAASYLLGVVELASTFGKEI